MRSESASRPQSVSFKSSTVVKDTGSEDEFVDPVKSLSMSGYL
jgi:hypothetical protein